MFLLVDVRSSGPRPSPVLWLAFVRRHYSPRPCHRPCLRRRLCPCRDPRPRPRPCPRPRPLPRPAPPSPAFARPAFNPSQRLLVPAQHSPRRSLLVPVGQTSSSRRVLVLVRHSSVQRLLVPTIRPINVCTYPAFVCSSPDRLRPPLGVRSSRVRPPLFHLWRTPCGIRPSTPSSACTHTAVLWSSASPFPASPPLSLPCPCPVTSSLSFSRRPLVEALACSLSPWRPLI